MESDLESLLGRSFPLPGDADKIREIFAASHGDDRLGIPLARNGERLRYAYPCCDPRRRQARRVAR